MHALTWHGRGDIRYESVPDPRIEDSRDAIVKVTSCAICGSDLHILDGFVPTMHRGDVMGHEAMGEVVEVGPGAQHKLKAGDRVVVPFTISCGECRMCRKGLYSLCERSNPAGEEEAKIVGYPTAGLYGYSHTYGGFAGGQAELLRVPYADVGPIKVPDGLSDDQAVLLSDVFPTAYSGAEMCAIQPGQTIAVFGCGPIGLLAIRSCFLLGAERVIAIDTVPERLALARSARADTLDFSAGHLQEHILELTHGEGPDAVIEAVGLESSGHGLLASAQEKMTSMERPFALEEAIRACRPGGIIAELGVFIAGVPVMMGAVVAKALTIKAGQTHVQKYLAPLMDRIVKGEIDPAFIITDRIPLSEGPAAYARFRDKQGGCIKVVMHPQIH